MIKILIVDDEKPICDLIDINLSAAGYECKSVQDGLKAIDLIESEQFDLILLDINMQGMDGFQVIEAIRKQGIKTPVIIFENQMPFSACRRTAARFLRKAHQAHRDKSGRAHGSF